MKNREIKFRAFDTSMPYMSNPFTLYDIQSGKIQFTKDVSIMQFTGMYDKNGKEIYEGDLCKISIGHPYRTAKTYQVIFRNGAFQMLPTDGEVSIAFVTMTKQALDNGYEYDHIGEFIEIIGNIYENPELL